MAMIALVSDLCNCKTVLDYEKAEEYENNQAMLRLICELNEGRRTGETEGYLSADEVHAKFRQK